MRGLVVGLLDVADLFRRLEVAFPSGDVLVVDRDLPPQLLGGRGVLLDVGLQLLDLRFGLIMCAA